MARSRDSHGERGMTAKEAGIDEGRAALLRKVAASLVKRNPGLMDRWLKDPEGTAHEFDAAFEAEWERMYEAGELD